jgi:hypothetical protein
MLGEQHWCPVHKQSYVCNDPTCISHTFGLCLRAQRETGLLPDGEDAGPTERARA